MSPKPTSTPLVYLVKVPCYSDVVSPPLGIGYLASHVGDVARVRLIDGIREPVTPHSLAAMARRENPAIIGLSVPILSSYSAKMLGALPSAAFGVALWRPPVPTGASAVSGSDSSATR